MARDHVHLRGCWVKFAIDLHPSRSEDVMGGVREQLHGLLLRYNEELEGVILSYSKERILSTQARIHDYFPYFHVDVMALVFLFKPTLAAAINGMVNAIGQDYIGVLVLGIFNAAIGRAQIPSHMQHRAVENCWSSAMDRHSRIRVGSALCFTVHKVHHEGEFFTLAGSLLENPAAAAAAAAAAVQNQRQPVRPAAVRLPLAANAAPAAAAPVQPKPTPSKAAADDVRHSPARQAGKVLSGTPATAPAAAGGAQQPEHRKKKRRHSAADTAGMANGIVSAVKPAKKRKHKQHAIAEAAH